MKRGTTPTIPIEHDLNISQVKSVRFIFKQKKAEDAPVILIKSYPDEVTEENGVFLIPFTEAETRRFKEGKNFYCDPKVTFANGKIPATEILTLNCSPTLWGVHDG